MGQTCSDDSEWCNNDKLQRQKTRQKFTSTKVGQKQAIQIKKHSITKQYTVISPAIGKGSYGSVYKVINKESGIERAAKKVPKKTKNKDYMQEILLLKKLDNPHIVKILDIYEEELFIFIVMEFCSGGELFDRIVQRQSMTESVARQYMKQILSGVSYCHMNNVMHRDLKPQNIMFNSPKSEDLKIIDFGAGKIKESGQKNTVKVGSVYYIAPEVIKKNYDEKCDIWSAGVILFMMISGNPPFNGRTDKSIFDKILKGSVNFPQKKWRSVSEQVKDLITKMLQYNPQKRYSAKKALNHDWFRLKKDEGERNLFLMNEMESIRKFSKMNKFQSKIVTFISRNLQSTKSLGKLQKKFNEMDKNNDGRISWKQFKYCYLQVMDPIEQQKIKKMFIKLDQNNSGYIDYSEFVASTYNEERLEENEILDKAFNMIDTNHNGYLSRQEISNAIGGVSEQIYEQMLRECDLDKDGQISRQQFMIAMRKLVKNKNV